MYGAILHVVGLPERVARRLPILIRHSLQPTIKDAVNKPLSRLREEMGGMNEDVPYVVYCNTGERSASAAFILNKMGYQVFAIRGGMGSVTQLLSMVGN